LAKVIILFHFDILFIETPAIALPVINKNELKQVIQNHILDTTFKKPQDFIFK